MIARGTYYRIESAKAWGRLWRRHTLGAGQAGTKSPAALGVAEVDFDRRMVVAAFEGKSENCASSEVHSVLETGDRITVRLHKLGFATGVGSEPQATTAGGIFLLPRSAKPLHIELDTGSGKQGIAKWTHVAEFRAGDGAREK
jgi:hypothetical protein